MLRSYEEEKSVLPEKTLVYQWVAVGLLKHHTIPLPSRGAPWNSVERNFSVFRQKIQRAVIFYLFANPAETAYLGAEMDSFLTPYSLSNSGQEELQFTPFWGGPKRVCSDGLRAGTIESHNFFVLCPILVKFHIRNSPNQELSNDLSDVVVRRRKVALHTISHLTPTEAWQSAFPPLGRVVEFRARYRQIPVRRFWG